MAVACAQLAKASVPIATLSKPEATEKEPAAKLLEALEVELKPIATDFKSEARACVPIAVEELPEDAARTPKERAPVLLALDSKPIAKESTPVALAKVPMAVVDDSSGTARFCAKVLLAQQKNIGFSETLPVEECALAWSVVLVVSFWFASMCWAVDGEDFTRGGAGGTQGVSGAGSVWRDFVWYRDCPNICFG